MTDSVLFIGSLETRSTPSLLCSHFPGSPVLNVLLYNGNTVHILLVFCSDNLSLSDLDHCSCNILYSYFNYQSILISNFASRLFGPFFLSSSLQLITYSLVFTLMFFSEPTFMQQKFAYNVGLVSTYSAHEYSTFS